MKNWNVFFLAAVLLVIYFGNGMISELVESQKSLKDELLKNRADMNSIITKIGADEKEKMLFYKLQKNQDVWAGTACGACHTSIQNALPITKISVSEAMQIVREGNEHTLAAGMPKFSARATRDRNSITDADLKVRLDALYIKELLDFAKDKPQPNTGS